ncbi:SpaH/EbpB family LPXTG-anchored major pilin [Corynebacterium choanae]|uniref:Fimbrial subunit type 1 n=1 Tax=Corynebacterium choanae TaxID=1862358 RepID=A0A3G6J924_9CORY|nr:SpaH/EbpB family LPXTG-anchored major pilin [Corynebacterium choanae]AZA14567.1 Fimbrial subunit type 1 precursor [Corynebacterium choanae]
MTTKKLSLRVATHAMIAGLAFSSAGFAAVELATPAIAQDQDVNPANIDPAKKASLTLYKRLNPENRGTPTGKEDGNVSGTPLKGVTFKITKLNFDVTTFAGLDAARKLDPAKVTEKHLVGAPQEQVTDSEGKASFTDLAVGAYLVQETSAGENKNITLSPDFIVFLPMTDVTNQNAWNYDVVAYPKNTQTQVSKSLTDTDEDKQANVGDVIHYTVSADRPAIDGHRSYIDSFTLYDQAPANFKYGESDEKPVVKIGDTDLEENTDYTVVTSADGTRVGVVFTKTGATKVTQAQYGTKITATFPFKVVSANDETISPVNLGGLKYTSKDREKPIDPGQPIPENPTDPDPDDSWNPENPVDPEDPGVDKSDPETWVPVKINKVDAGDSATKLKDAKFNVFRCTKENGETGVDGSAGSAKAVLVGNKLEVNDQAEWTTNDKGEATINALRLVKDWESDKTKGYCLVEAQAPSGYELLPSPYFFRITENNKSDVAAGMEVKNVNSNDNGFHLPATGGMGVGLLMALGAALAGAGVLWARRTSRS